jgi:hypothetical protein
MPISRAKTGISRAEARFRASEPSENLDVDFFSFFPCNPLKIQETTKEKLGDSKKMLGDSKRMLGDSKRMLGKKKKKLGAVPAISAGRRSSGRRLAKDE